MNQIAFVVAAVFMSGMSQTASAASDVSAGHDGVYSGTIQPATAISALNCPSFAIDDFKIERGFFAIKGIQDQPSFNGFVTAEGYVEGRMRLGQAAPFAFQGRISGVELNAGAIDRSTGCAWTANLKKRLP